MLDCEYTNCWWVNADILDENIVVENMGMGIESSSHLEKCKRYVDFAIVLIVHIIWRSCWFPSCGGRQEY